MLFPHATLRGEPGRVVVTGAGIVTALGRGWRANAAGFRDGRTAIGPVTLFDVSSQRARTAGQADLPSPWSGPALPARVKRRLTRGTQLLLVAAGEAWTQSEWQPSANLPVVLGTTNCGMDSGEAYHSIACELTRALTYQGQRQAMDVAETFGFRGPITVISNACASGTNAIGHAWELIRSGRAERVLAGGYDALCHLVFAGFDSLQALTTTTCRPFDAQRDGLVLGEGAGVLAMESLESAHRRDAEILGEVIGYGTSTDVHHLTQPQPEGRAVWAAMEDACTRAGVTPVQVDYVNAHGTGTPLNDAAEAAALVNWAGAGATRLPVSSTKGSIGHLLGAAGAVEAIVCLMALREQWLPPEPMVARPDAACGFDLVREPREARVDVALSNSIGFGGANATLILRRWT
jgi:3-oxoacyl-[acyl-carrier-protein] synthase II